MRILYHHRTASRDGQAVHIDELVAALRARGHDVRVVCPANKAAAGMGNKVSWVHWLKRHSPAVLYECMEVLYSIPSYLRLAAEVRRFKPQVIYERYNLFLMSGVLARRRFGLPLLLEVNAPVAHEREQHGGLALPRLAHWSQRLTWRGADAVLPVTRVLARYVEEAGVAAERISVIPNGINRAHFATAPDREHSKRAHRLDGKLVLGFTGFVRDWHGVDRVLRWMAEPGAPANAHLLLVGDGPAREGLERLARELRLDSRMTITGVVERAAIPDWVAAFDIALQPAVVPYASPLKLMEYLALGKAIVAPGEANLLEVLEHGRNAWIFDAAHPSALADALTTLARDEALRARLGEGAAATIERLQLTWDGNAERVEALALALLATGADRRTRRAAGAVNDERDRRAA